MHSLCQTCQRIFKVSISDDSFHKKSHHNKLGELQESSASDCFLCSVLLARLIQCRHEQPNSWVSDEHAEKYGSSSVSRYSLGGSHNHTGIIELGLEFNEDGCGKSGLSGGGWQSYRIQPLQHYRDATGTVFGIKAEDLSPEVAHPPFSIDHARRWLRNCLDHHKSCQIARTRTNGQLPTRLLEIDKPEVGKVCLLDNINSLSLGLRRFQYVTSSHRWGQSHTLRLTSATHRCLNEGIALSELGQTFKDSIMVARNLGVPFIWIDSLCIIQDSAKDWLQEAPRMAAVYGGALCNIAATSGPNTDAGLWPRQDALFGVEPFVVKLEKATGFPEGKYVLYDREYHVNAFKEMPLMTRGWVVQELLLAPRVLHFCTTELFWECSELLASETYPGGLPPDVQEFWISREVMKMVLKKPSNHTSEQLLDIVSHGSDIATKSRLLEAWSAIVEVYSKCDLTFMSDKLVAISGIARLLQTIFKSDYYAGLWEEDFLQQLLWTGNTSERRYPAKSYRAPTWSWASMNGAIRFGYNGTRTWHEVVAIRDSPPKTQAANFAAKIVKGQLRLSGWLMAMKLQSKPRLNSIDETWDIYVNGTWQKNNNGGLFIMVRLDNDSISTKQVHALPIAVDPHESPDRFVIFLLLCPTGDGKGQFYRIGVMHTVLEDLGIRGEDYSALGKMMSEPWLEYESCDETGLYTLVLV